MALEPGLVVAVPLTVLLAASFFRRRRSSDAPPAPAGGGPKEGGGAKRGLFRRVPDASKSGATMLPRSDTPPLPEYFEGPPEPPAPPSTASHAKDGPEIDLETLLAQLDRLSEQIRRRAPERAAKGAGEAKSGDGPARERPPPGAGEA